jgi:predicted SnoaL-like aldol condensation-catalyzing enzyme
MRITTVLCTAALSLGLSTAIQAQVPPEPVKDQLPLLASKDPKLAANKKLVFDMYREVVNAGHTGNSAKYFTDSYIQHNPNVKSGRQALVDYIKQTRPERAIPPQITFPVISITAEGEYVTVATVSYEDDLEKPGEKFITTHFDMYRLEKGLIAEHWDNVSRSSASKTKDPNVTNRPK